MHGWRGRIGLVVPSTNTTCEMEFHRLAPEGVSVHTARVFLPEADDPETRIEQIRAMDKGLLDAVREVASVEPGVIVWACTAASFLGGERHEAHLARELAQAVGIPVLTTSGAVVDALRELGVRRVAMATPYVDAINKREKLFLEVSLPGLEVVGLVGAGIVGNLPKGRLAPESAYLAGRQVNTDAAEAVFLSCTNWRTLEILESLEQDLGKPVISSVQASAWRAFRELALPDLAGPGRLLRRIQSHSAPDDP